MEPVSIYLEVRRGKTVLLRMGAAPGGLGEWDSPTPLNDIQTPQGPLRNITILSSIRDKERTVQAVRTTENGSLCYATDADWDEEAW
jgi:hypothetical protein